MLEATFAGYLIAWREKGSQSSFCLFVYLFACLLQMESFVEAAVAASRLRHVADLDVLYSGFCRAFAESGGFTDWHTVLEWVKSFALEQ